MEQVAWFPHRLAVWAASDQAAVVARARALGTQLALPVAHEANVTEFALLLTVTDDRLELREAGSAHRQGHSVNFRDAEANLSKRQPLAKAFGKDVKTIVDATAGWGRDAFLLARFGYHVTAVERSPVVAALLRDGVERASRQAIFEVKQGDARDVLRAVAVPPDAVYLDPMYPPKKKKSARSRKGIELLRTLVGTDEDAGDLFTQAMAAATRRVVVKRADDAPLLATEPTISFGGKTVRYDVYVTLGR